MEHFEIELTASGFHISGFPDATKVIRLSGHKAQQISELTSHRNDLLIALASLQAINGVALDILSKARSRLDPKKVFKGDGDALEVYDYFRSLRNKHVAHDENAFVQCIAGAVLNRPGAQYKIAKIVCFSAVADTLDQASYSNLHKMVTETLSYIDTRFGSLCDSLTEELEARLYVELAAMEEMTYSKPGPEDVDKSRSRH